MGQAWTVVCTRISLGEFSSVSGALDNDEIRKVFMDEFKNSVRRRLPAGGSESGRGAERPPPAEDAEAPAASSCIAPAARSPTARAGGGAAGGAGGGGGPGRGAGGAAGRRPPGALRAPRHNPRPGGPAGTWGRRLDRGLGPQLDEPPAAARRTRQAALAG